MQQFRQGDVLIERCDNLTPEQIEQAEKLSREAGRIVLAHGEATGHAHAIPSPHAALYAFNGERFLHARKGVTLRHEEHALIRIPAGTWKITRQREYTPEAIRTVAD